jgi:hypothetical protein
VQRFLKHGLEVTSKDVPLINAGDLGDALDTQFRPSKKLKALNGQPGRRDESPCPSHRLSRALPIIIESEQRTSLPAAWV